jgi:putative hemolysin
MARRFSHALRIDLSMENSILFSLVGVLAVGLLVLANAFFVAAEFSLISIRRTRVAELAARGEAGADAVQNAINDPDRIIAATQLGITLASLALGWIGEPALGHLLEPVLKLLPQALQTAFVLTLPVALAFILITFLHVVAGELAPKSIALQYTERTALFVARPILWVTHLFKPAIWALNGTGNALLRLFGVQPASGHQLAHSVEELKMLVTASAQGAVIEEDESEMLHAVFDFGEMVVRQVMVPRTEVIAVQADAPLQDIIGLVTESTYTKFPVYVDGLDQIIGIVHAKDLLNAMQKSDCESCTARSLVREALFVPETLPVAGLLRLFRVHHQHIAIILDEFGGTAGLVTLQDLLEEIVGEVSDVFDVGVPGIQALADGSILIDGLTLITDVNAQLGLSLQDPYYDTIAGYVMGKLGRIPSLHDAVEGDGIRIRVVEMDGLRVARVSLTRLDTAAPSQDTAVKAG